MILDVNINKGMILSLDTKSCINIYFLCLKKKDVKGVDLLSEKRKNKMYYSFVDNNIMYSNHVESSLTLLNNYVIVIYLNYPPLDEQCML